MARYGNPVTEPEILSKLNKPNGDQYGDAVTNSELLAKLNLSTLNKKQTSPNRQTPEEEFINYFPKMYSPTSALQFGGLHAFKEHPLTSQLTLGAIIPSAEVGAGKMLYAPVKKYITNYLASIAQNAGVNAGLNALESGNRKESAKRGAETGAGVTAVVHPLTSLFMNSNPVTRSLMLGAAGLAGGSYLGNKAAHPYLGAEAGTAVGSILPFLLGSKSRAAGNILSHLNPQEALPAKQAAQRFGITDMTPAATTNNPIVNAAQQDIGTSTIGAKRLYDSSQRFQQQTSNALNEMLNTIAPKDIKTNLESPLYEASKNDLIPMNNLVALAQNPTIKNAINQVTKNPELAHELKNSPINSIAHLDAVKKYLDGKIKNTNDTNTKRILGNAKKELLEEADKVSPDYKAAREVSSRRQIREKLESSIEQHGLSNIISNDEKYSKLYNSLQNRDNPEQVSFAQDRLESFKTAFKNIKDPLTQKAIARLASHDNDIVKPMEFIAKQIHRITNGSYDHAAAKLITDPRWEKELLKINKIKSNPKKALSWINLLTRAESISANKQEGSK